MTRKQARELKAPILVYKAFNHTYGPWYRLRTVDDKSVSGGEITIMPDMDRGRWYWYVRIGSKSKPRTVKSGHEGSLEEAKEIARATFDGLYQHE